MARLSGGVCVGLVLCVAWASDGRAELPGAGPKLKSTAALVLDQDSGQVLYGKNADTVLPIASITKLMTAMVVLDKGFDLDETVAITGEDIDSIRNSKSRLRPGVTLSRDDFMRLALLASENRAASALARSDPAGRDAFIAAMNHKAMMLGMTGTHFGDSTGLSSENVSTAEDLARLVRAAHGYPKIREYSTMTSHTVKLNGRPFSFRNTNRLVFRSDWGIGVSKTGFINEAGRCLVMQAALAGRNIVIVLLDSWGTYSRQADATRVRAWIEGVPARATPRKVAPAGAKRRMSVAAVTPAVTPIPVVGRVSAGYTGRLPGS